MSRKLVRLAFLVLALMVLSIGVAENALANGYCAICCDGPWCGQGCHWWNSCAGCAITCQNYAAVCVCSERFPSCYCNPLIE